MSNKHAFSIVELMIVIAIVAVIAAAAIPVFNHYLDRSKLSSLKLELNDVQKKILAHYNKSLTWPNAAALAYNDGGTTNNGNSMVTPLSSLLSESWIYGAAGCGAIDLVFDTTQFSGAMPSLSVSMVYGLNSDDQLETACSCNTGSGWGACTGSKLLEIMSCDFDLNDTTVTCAESFVPSYS